MSASSGPAADGAARRCDAFVERRIVEPTSIDGPLRGTRVAIKDILDVRGMTTGYGHPLWRETHEIAEDHADVVRLLLGAGATIVGKTHMDELAWSLFGANAHFGTPPNPAARDAVPGGSSSGSAAAVADGTVDFAIGTDTGGSVRVPASYCGLYGIRPTHGRVSSDRCCALAPSFDTVGWFARDMALLRRVGDVLLDPRHERADISLTSWIVASDAFALADPGAQARTYAAVSSAKDAIVAAAGFAGPPEEVALDVFDGGSFDSWFDAFRMNQSYEVWQELGPWIQKHGPVPLGPGVKERFAFAQGLDAAAVAPAAERRREITQRVEEVVGDGTVLVVPTTPGVPPTLAEVAGPAAATEAGMARVDDIRGRLLRLTSIAGLSGLPQISTPLPIPTQAEGGDGGEEGGPLGLSFIGPRGSDAQLCRIVERIAGAIHAGG